MAIRLIVTAKNGISLVELGRRPGVRQAMAWTTKQKIMAVMARREGDKPLLGRAEVDDAYLGGVRLGGNRGRGAPGKTPFLAGDACMAEMEGNHDLKIGILIGKVNILLWGIPFVFLLLLPVLGWIVTQTVNSRERIGQLEGQIRQLGGQIRLSSGNKISGQLEWPIKLSSGNKVSGQHAGADHGSGEREE